ncbi:MAG: hypothetical protein QM771_10860 [Nitrospira sp.]
MKPDRVLLISVICLLTMAVSFPSPAAARPKGTAQSCNNNDLNTNFGASCNDQMQQDLINNKPYTHVLFCGGETTLCCTVDNQTNQVLNCRKPAGSRAMFGMQGTTLGAAGKAGIQKRGVDATAPEPDEEAPVPSTLTPDVVKELLHTPAAK